MRSSLPGHHLRSPDGAPMTRKLTSINEREGDGYLALCPEVDVVS